MSRSRLRSKFLRGQPPTKLYAETQRAFETPLKKRPNTFTTRRFRLLKQILTLEVDLLSSVIHVKVTRFDILLL